ncbi:ROK family protein [Microbacterium sp. Marseille-Q6965]|uniref:ROK family protein n=1 Tax=Microbacterium sp. Marseille-Q6965 TaxID=2965072 RepID=UPI0021B73EB3|nr:ROK family protein [Microbacterium sp. Marseille-Q6965]
MSAVALGVDLGGTKVEAALVTGDGVVVPGTRCRRATGREVTPSVLRDGLSAVVGDALAHLPAGVAFAGAGIGSAGPVDLSGGTIAPVNMPGVRGFGIVDAVRDAVIGATGLPDAVVRLRHDGGCLALAESWIGAAAGSRASLSIVVSTGVGGGIVIEGRPIGGASGNAGHLGQTFVDGSTTEEIASGPHTVRWARQQGWDGETGEDLARSAAEGDPLARAAVERSARAVGRALADAATLLDLDVIAIGGGFSRVSADYVDLVAATVRETAVLPYARSVRVVRSALGDEGPLVGAAALVLR